MFGWFKKSAVAQKKTPSLSEKERLSAPANVDKITKNEFLSLIDAFFKANAHASVFYAQCAGMKDGTINENNFGVFFNSIMTVNPDNLLAENIRRAVDYQLSECIFSLTTDIWELSLGIISTEAYAQRKFRQLGMSQDILKDASKLQVGKNSFLRDDLEKLRQKVLRLGPNTPHRDLFDDFDIEQTMLNFCLERQRVDYDKIVGAIDEKFDVLKPIFSRLKNTSTNKYGDYDARPTIDELEEFLNYTFTQDDFNFYFTVKPYEKLLSYIESKLESSCSRDMPLDGIEFEHWTANEISRQGWGVQVSQASGDQGVDVVARREGCSVAIQCKRYTQPIGNKAVQEVFAAKQFCSADHACVVGTGGFTRSARELAAATGVILIEAEAGLQSFSERFGFEAMEDLDGEPLADIDNEALSLARKYMDEDGNPYKHEVLIENRNQLGIFLQSRSTLDQYTYSNDDGETVQRYLAQTKHLADTALPFTVQLDAFTAMVHLNVGILVLTSSITDQQRQKTLNDPDEEPRILSMLESRDENEEVFVFEILSMSALNELVVFLETIARSFNIELEDEGYEQIKHHLNFAA